MDETRRAISLCDDAEVSAGFWPASLRELPDIERMDAEGPLQKPSLDVERDGVLEFTDDDASAFDDHIGIGRYG